MPRQGSLYLKQNNGSVGEQESIWYISCWSCIFGRVAPALLHKAYQCVSTMARTKATAKKTQRRRRTSPSGAESSNPNQSSQRRAANPPSQRPASFEMRHTRSRGPAPSVFSDIGALEREGNRRRRARLAGKEEGVSRNVQEERVREESSNTVRGRGRNVTRRRRSASPMITRPIHGNNIRRREESMPAAAPGSNDSGDSNGNYVTASTGTEAENSGIRS